MAFVHGRKVMEALLAEGIADNQTRRVVIDIPVNDMVTIYTERIGDERVLKVVEALASVEVRRE